MSSAVGAYATVLPVKERLGLTDESLDSLLQTLCNEANGWLEQKIGRPICPWPSFTTTVVSGFAAGTNSGVLTATDGLALGDALMLGPVTGTHEHGTVVDITGTTVTLQANLASSYSASVVAKRVYILDGYSAMNYRTLAVHNGIVACRSLEQAVLTGGPFSLIAGGDYFLRPVPAKRTPGWPATRIQLSDYPSGGSSITPYFYMGYGNLRLDAVLGWPAIPDELAGLAQKLAISLYRRRGSGTGPTAAIGTDSEMVFQSSMEPQDWQLLKLYADEFPGI